MKLTEEQRIILDGEIALAILRSVKDEDFDEMIEHHEKISELCNTAIENFLATC